MIVRILDKAGLRPRLSCKNNISALMDLHIAGVGACV